MPATLMQFEKFLRSPGTTASERMLAFQVLGESASSEGLIELQSSLGVTKTGVKDTDSHLCSPATRVYLKLVALKNAKLASGTLEAWLELEVEGGKQISLRLICRFLPKRSIAFSSPTIRSLDLHGHPLCKRSRSPQSPSAAVELLYQLPDLQQP